MSSYPAECRISLERRTIPGETPEGAAADIMAILDRIGSEDPAFRAELLPRLARAPFEAKEDWPIVEALRQAATARLGKAVEFRGEAFWTDCAILAGAGIPCVMFGANGGGAHAAEEWAEEASVEALADILFDTAVRFCGRAGRD